MRKHDLYDRRTLCVTVVFVNGYICALEGVRVIALQFCYSDNG